MEEEILAQLPEKFNAKKLEQVLGCHVSTVELHALRDRGTLSCCGSCAGCVHARNTNDVEDKREILLDRKGMPLSIDRAPCAFSVANVDAFKLWVNAKLNQKAREAAPKVSQALAIIPPEKPRRRWWHFFRKKS